MESPVDFLRVKKPEWINYTTGSRIWATVNDLQQGYCCNRVGHDGRSDDPEFRHRALSVSKIGIRQKQGQAIGCHFPIINWGKTTHCGE